MWPRFEPNATKHLGKARTSQGGQQLWLQDTIWIPETEFAQICVKTGCVTYQSPPALDHGRGLPS